jgi:UDP-3-O-[3-hydroxymyristoyl] glucosamine N-acyltransferase
MRLSEIAGRVGGRLRGEDAEIVKVSSFQQAGQHSLVYAVDAAALQTAAQSNAGAVITGEFAAEGDALKPLLIHPQPKLAFARAARLLQSEATSEGIHPTAIVAPGAQIGSGVSIAPYAVVGEHAVIGDGTRIGAHAVIGQGVKVGLQSTIHAHVSVYPGVRIGQRVVVHAGAVLGSDGFGYVQDRETGRYEQFPQLGTLVLEDDVEIGANTTIDRGALEATVIRRGTKLDNLVHIAHNVEVGEDVVIAAQTGVSGSSMIERRAVVAGQVGIADHVRIEEGVILGAQCGVPSGKVIRGKGVLFWGTPARPIKEYLKQLAVLAKLTKGK